MSRKNDCYANETDDFRNFRRGGANFRLCIRVADRRAAGRTSVASSSRPCGDRLLGLSAQQGGGDASVMGARLLHRLRGAAFDLGRDKPGNGRHAADHRDPFALDQIDRQGGVETGHDDDRGAHAEHVCDAAKTRAMGIGEIAVKTRPPSSGGMGSMLKTAKMQFSQID